LLPLDPLSPGRRSPVKEKAFHRSDPWRQRL